MMVEKAIVTFCIPRERWQADFEVPTFLSCAELGKRLLGALREMDRDRFGNWEKLRFRFHNRILEQERTLCQYGVWDGSKLELLQ
jgi:hypothetical protein